mmetsp:Transcript_40148/g.106217  ORF Transcript_40148/g.106217 Transcript_40148/m.106217 type:complete len:348 (+) Transcript_40148:16-1059(+)
MRRARLLAALSAPATGVVAYCAAVREQTWPTMRLPISPSTNAFGDVEGVFNYQAADVTHVFTRRDGGGSDATLHGAQWDAHQVVVRNGRQQPGITFDKSGFALHSDPKEVHVDYYDEQSVICTYYSECEELLRCVTGARYVRAFDHNVRSEAGQKSGKRLHGGNLVQGPAGIVHGDYTAASAPRRLRLLSEAPKMNDPLRPVLGDTPLVPPAVADDALLHGRRFAFINIWRPISTVLTNPLACCDASTVSADDLLVFEIHYADRIGENYFAKYSPSHGWHYFPKMTRDEVLLLKQWDSCGDLVAGASAVREAAPPSTFSLHSAFLDPSSPPGAPDRESIEVRLVAIY